MDSSERMEVEVSVPSVNHLEWMTGDHRALMQFMHALFGWEFQSFGPDYFLYSPHDDKATVGIGRRDGLTAGNGVPNVVIAVDSIDVTLEKAIALGGEAVVPKTLISSEIGAAPTLKRRTEISSGFSSRRKDKLLHFGQPKTRSQSGWNSCAA